LEYCGVELCPLLKPHLFTPSSIGSGPVPYARSGPVFVWVEPFLLYTLARELE
jgi:hypothetical protein